MRRSLPLAVVTAFAFTIGANTLSAQAPGSAPMPAAFAPHHSALLEPAHASPLALDEQPANNLALQNEGPRESVAVALMIVGAAGIIVGAATGEGVVTVAGAAAAGIGLYLWLR